jgi:hypothetical protein
VALGGVAGRGGQDDAGVPEQFLDGLQVGAGGVGQGGGAVPEVVQPYRRQTGQDDEATEASGQVVRVQGGAVRGGEHVGEDPRRHGSRGSLSTVASRSPAPNRDGSPVATRSEHHGADGWVD